jgi:hypothetical protein
MDQQEQATRASSFAVACDVPLDLLESSTLASYQPSGQPQPKAKAVKWVYNPSDGSVLLTHKFDFEYF